MICCPFSRCPYAELVSTCDIISEHPKAQAEAFSIPNQYPYIDAMLAGAEVDLQGNLTDMQESGVRSHSPTHSSVGSMTDLNPGDPTPGAVPPGRARSAENLHERRNTEKRRRSRPG